MPFSGRSFVGGSFVDDSLVAADGFVPGDTEASRLLVIIGGQSNAVGTGLAAGLSDSSFTLPYPAVRYTANMGTSADPPVVDSYPPGDLDERVYQGILKFGVELSLGRDLDHTLPGKIAIAKFAYSSTSLNANWAPAGTYPTTPPNLFTQFVNYIRAAELATDSKLAAIIWIQGENDAGSLGTANAYGANLVAFVTALRAQLGGTAPFIYGRLNTDYAGGAFTTELRASQAAADGDLPNLIMMDQDSVDLGPDTVHYLADGYIQLGHLYADAVLAALGINAKPFARFTYVKTGLQVTCTDASTDRDGTIASRLYNFGDGATSTATNPVHVYASAGPYTVSLTVTDNDGGSHTYQEVVVVTAVAWSVDGGVAIPASNAEWTALIAAAGLTGVFFPPDSGYLCQDLTSPIADYNGGFPLTAVGTGQAYQQPVAGMTGKGIALAEATTGSWSTTSASLPDMATGSSIILGFVETPAAAPAAIRNIFQLGTAALAAARLHNTSRIGALSGANSQPGTVNPMNRFMPIALAVDRDAGDGDGSDQFVLTDQETITVTFGATIAGKAFRIGSNGNAAAMKYRAVWRWDNRTATVATMKTLLTTMGFTMAP